jgi:hypothetical protein
VEVSVIDLPSRRMVTLPVEQALVSVATTFCCNGVFLW